MTLPFKLLGVFSPESSPAENAIALKAALEFLIGLNMLWLRNTRNVPSLYRSGVRYRETPDWLDILALYKQGFGDCKSLTAALIAEKRIAGKQALAEFRFFARSDGYADYHILVVNGDGQREDPSRILGMPSDLDF